MNFNPDTTEQAQEVIFSYKLKKKRFIFHYSLIMPVLVGRLLKNNRELHLTIS